MRGGERQPYPTDGSREAPAGGRAWTTEARCPPPSAVPPAASRAGQRAATWKRHSGTVKPTTNLPTDAFAKPGESVLGMVVAARLGCGFTSDPAHSTSEGHSHRGPAPRPAPPAPRPHPRLAQGARHPRRTDNHPGAHDVCDIRARLVAAGAAQRAGPSRPPSPRPRRRRPGPPPRRILSSAPPSAHPPRASPWSDRPPPAQRCCGSAGMWGHFGSRFRPV